eukprot:gene12603-26530_t
MINLVGSNNIEEMEKWCFEYIDDPKTNPLQDLNNVKRNITLDSKMESECEPLLENAHITMNSRLKIHEGLGYLAVRHSQMGYDRHEAAMRHFRILARTLNDSYILALRAGYWAMSHDLTRHKDAASYFYNAIYGPASKSKESDPDNLFNIKRLYARLLGYILNIIESRSEYIDIVTHHPDDFESVYLLSESYRITDSSQDDDVQQMNIKTKAIYDNILKFATNEYNGFTYPSITDNNKIHSTKQNKHNNNNDNNISNNDSNHDNSDNCFSNNNSNKWQPKTFRNNVQPTPEEFQEFVEDREPIIISLENLSAMGWKTDSWTPDYLIQHAGNASVEVQVRPVSSRSVFGISLDTYVKKRTFKRFIEGRYSKSIDTSTSTKVEDTNMTELPATTSPSPSSSSMYPLKYDNDNVMYVDDMGDNRVRSEEYILTDDNLILPKYENKVEVVLQYEEFLSVQSSKLKTSPNLLSVPLNLLMKDIPRPNFLTSIWKDMSDVNLHMGNSISASTSTCGGSKVQLHMDALDSLYVNIKGNKTIHMFSPKYALQMLTICPSYKVIQSGFSLQYKGPSFGKYGTDTTTCFYSSAHSVNDPILGDARNEHVTITLTPSQILYIPAGWFFETNYHPGQHMAVNFWWRPPGWRQTLPSEKVANATLCRDMGLIDDKEYKIIISNLRKDEKMKKKKIKNNNDDEF